MKRAIVFLLIALTPLATAARPAQPEDLADMPAATSSRTPLLRKVDDAISRGSHYLLSHQNADGSFGEGQTPAMRVGQTSLVTLALLSCGESHQSKQLIKAIDFLRKTRALGRDGTYAIGLRACVWATLPEPLRGNSLKTDLAWLLATNIKKGPNDGMYSYPTGGEGDFSNSQYGVLGVWYAANSGLEVPSTYWKRVETVWQKYQSEDGGWSYMPNWGQPYASMTAAGTATLYITNDYLHANEAQDLSVPVINKPLDRAVAWLSRNFAVDVNAGRDTEIKPKDKSDDILDRIMGRNQRDGGTFVHYMLFGYERVGEASGLTRFGTHRWFDEGAEFLIEKQAYEGSWTGSLGPICDTSYALLFLSRGRSPVAIQKLQLGKDGAGRWNNRPRDAANFIHFMRHAAERHMNWQIVDSQAPLSDLREAPILYIASDRPLELSETQRNNILSYVNEGGLLLLVNEGKGDAFTRSAIALCKDLWPSYSFRDLPKEHPIISNNFPMNGWTDPIRGLSNGVRELVVMFPSGDVSWKWQAGGGATQVNLSPYSPLANLWLYLNGAGQPRFKGETTWIDRDESIDDAPVKRMVARLKYYGNWQPEPLAWTRLSNILHNTKDAELAADVIDIGRDKIKTPYAIAHLSAAESFALRPLERAEIKTLPRQGGSAVLRRRRRIGRSNAVVRSSDGRLVSEAQERASSRRSPDLHGQVRRRRRAIQHRQLQLPPRCAGQTPAHKAPAAAWLRAQRQAHRRPIRRRPQRRPGRLSHQRHHRLHTHIRPSDHAEHCNVVRLERSLKLKRKTRAPPFQGQGMRARSNWAAIPASLVESYPPTLHHSPSYGSLWCRRLAPRKQ